MKHFLLIFEDLLTWDHRRRHDEKPKSKRVAALSKEELISTLGLQQRKAEPSGYYWDGHAGEVLIAVHELPDQVDEMNPAALRVFVRELRNEWY